MIELLKFHFLVVAAYMYMDIIDFWFLIYIQ